MNLIGRDSWFRSRTAMYIGTSLASAAVPNSETLAVATAVATTSLLLSPVRDRLNITGRGLGVVAAVGLGVATGFNALVDDGAVDRGASGVTALEAGAYETYTDFVVPTWNLAHSFGDKARVPADAFLNLVGVEERIEDGVAGTSIDIFEEDIGDFLRQAISPYEDITLPEYE